MNFIFFILGVLECAVYCGAPEPSRDGVRVQTRSGLPGCDGEKREHQKPLPQRAAVRVPPPRLPPDGGAQMQRHQEREGQVRHHCQVRSFILLSI